ncbi:hypothetical protein [Tepidibacillus fermentans]|uniref:Uncharacterized protein n=1 Tax=Tepidibacillus fermentans TaxID=1281767 RepID=A0A4R3KCT6_9BACI|nr:hypothetical protein [Tepidibacillus fermentans]TCS81054.1 hypothetical protein EDD72_11432 [Tepidibacillus fermentans]
MRYQSVIVFGKIGEVEGEEKRVGLIAFLEKYATDNMEKGKLKLSIIFQKGEKFDLLYKNLKVNIEFFDHNGTSI